MALNISSLANDLRHIIDDLPQTIIYKGQSVSVACDDLSEGRELEMMGFEGNSNLMFYALKSDFATQPRHNDVVTYLDKEYKIDRIEIAADGVGLKVYCITKSR